MARKSRKNVGLIGLGIIGSRVAAGLRSAGFQVFVWNRTARAAPNFLSSPAEVADVCNVIQLFVADAAALFEIIDAFLPNLTPNHTILCNGTVGPEATIEAAKIVEARGARFLDAPFTGSKMAAERRELVYYIGGSDEVLRQVEPVLRASCKAIVKIGEIGDAATIKIATNMLVAVTAQTLAEALALVKRSGIDPKALGAALEHHAARSGLTDMKLPKMIEGDYEPHFSMKHMFKDVQLAIHIANALDLDIPATTATAGVMYGGLNRGWADLDFAALMRVYEDQEEIEAADALIGTEAPAGLPAHEPDHDRPAAGSTGAEKHDEPRKETLSHLAPAPPRPEAKHSAAAETHSTYVEAQVSDEPIAEYSPREGAREENALRDEDDANAAQASPNNTTAGGKRGPAKPLNRVRRWFKQRAP